MGIGDPNMAEMLLAHAALSSGVGRGFNRWGERPTDSAAFFGGKDRVPFPGILRLGAEFWPWPLTPVCVISCKHESMQA